MTPAEGLFAAVETLRDPQAFRNRISEARKVVQPPRGTNTPNERRSTPTGRETAWLYNLPGSALTSWFGDGDKKQSSGEGETARPAEPFVGQAGGIWRCYSCSPIPVAGPGCKTNTKQASCLRWR